MSTDLVLEQKPVQQPEARVQEYGEVLRVTRGSIGEAVITTDAAGRVTFLNSVAESLTGCTCQEAMGQPWPAVFQIVNEESQRRLERAVADARAYADDIVATVREPLVVLDAELRVRTANRSFYQEFRVTPADTEERFLYDLGDGQWNIPVLRTLLEGILPQNTSFHDFEVEHTFPVLGHRTMLLNARSILGEGNHSGMILLAIEDITERKRAAQAVAVSEVRYRRLFETAQDAILILDGDTGKIIDSNPFLSDLLGYSPDELLGKELWEIGLFQDIEANRAAFRQLQEQGYIRYEDLPLETKDGRRAYVEFVSNVYPVEGHQVIQCNIRDISDRKRAEEALREADRRKDEFLAMLAHELRNPLAPLRNAMQVMRLKGTDDPDVRWARDVVERQVQQLTRLVDDLLDIARFNRGMINLQMEPVDMAAVVARAVEISRPLIDAHKHYLHVSLPGQAVRVEGDLTRLAQVLSNLLNNAAKYTEEGGRIDLTVEPSGREAVLRVRDTGVGIAADMLPRIFEMFTQVQGSVSRSEGGLGIGLTLVRKLVEMHGGRVEAHSEGHGHGSEFVVRLPLLRQAVLPAAAEAEQQRPRKVPARNVLIVDDNQDAAESLALLLRLAGQEVRTAYDGPAALDLARARPPDVVMLDIGMPGMDGLEVARRLRQDLGLKRALLVALTGYGGEEDRRRCQEAGFNAHLVKPADVCALKRLLARPALTGQEPME
ncbi:MAG TPA: PAS domain S-box protein [Gemmataceae bacterium]|nr:PAS domain S-box protein [Gemmataceae bacterium]